MGEMLGLAFRPDKLLRLKSQGGWERSLSVVQYWYIFASCTYKKKM